ncbi:hypothetical protein [Epibacterium ulvae]|uniref:hypothetical protein n=1 Tax=Epibacterium ulvae TaxID=1156985 RepID=UPI00248FEE5A|nr:hypothetical protein [Epibacterium ulvae]
MKRFSISAVLTAMIASAASAEDFVVQPDFLPPSNQYYKAACEAPFTGWVDPFNAHLVVITEDLGFSKSPTATQDIQACIEMTSIWLTQSGLTKKPVRFELTDTTGRVLITQTLAFNN